MSFKRNLARGGACMVLTLVMYILVSEIGLYDAANHQKRFGSIPRSKWDREIAHMSEEAYDTSRGVPITIAGAKAQLQPESHSATRPEDSLKLAREALFKSNVDRGREALFQGLKESDPEAPLHSATRALTLTRANPNPSSNPHGRFVGRL